MGTLKGEAKLRADNWVVGLCTLKRVKVERDKTGVYRARMREKVRWMCIREMPEN